eukprot:8778338-Alexandrium_andersonii.AAC.1
MRAARLLVRPAVLRHRVPTPARFAPCVSRPDAVARARSQRKSLVWSKQPWTIGSGPPWTAACVS